MTTSGAQHVAAHPPVPLPRPPEHKTGPVTVPAPRRAPEQWQGRYAAAVSTTDVALLVLCLGTGALLGITTLEGPGERAHLVAGVAAAALLVIGLAGSRRGRL